MKGNLKNSPLMKKWFYTQSPLIITRPALGQTAEFLGYLGGGFLLACGRLGATPAPFALSLVAASGGGLRGLGALIGAVVGFILVQPFAQGLQMASTGILIYVCSYIFGSLWVTRRGWFKCLVAGCMTALVGAIFLLSREVTPALAAGYAQNVLLTGLMPLSYDQLFRGKRHGAGVLAAVGSFFVGAAVIPLPLGMSLGAVGAVALVGLAARRTDLRTAALTAVGCGVALDAALLTGGLWTLALGCGGVIGGAAWRGPKMIRTALFAVSVGAVMLYTGNLSLMLGATLLLGAVLSAVLPGRLVSGREENAIAQSADQVAERLTSGNAALLRLYEATGVDPELRETREQNQVFDRAAARVCRRCSRFSQCWDREMEETYEMFVALMPKIQERGAVKREDFPAYFGGYCDQMEELISAINQELDSAACRNRSRSRQEEDRLIAGRVLLHLGRLLEQNARALRGVSVFSPEAYTVRLGVAARGRAGTRTSGDRGISLRTEDGRFYVILCDGAGTGEPAARESLLAVDTLAGLISAGMPPENAMELLSGIYILRDSGGFSTMDVLEIDLCSGQGVLYKWGAAPSFHRSGDQVQKIGSAAPPPGLGMGSSYGAEVLRLSLWGGDLLVLLSDGALGEETEQLIHDFAGGNVKALANQIIELAAEYGGEDDMTAAVLRIEECRL